MRTAIEFTLVLICGSLSVTLAIVFTAMGGWREYYWMFLVVACGFTLGLYLTNDSGNQRKTELVKEEEIWRQKGCPVYKVECGGKYKYSCEKKASVIGRNQVGDMFVEAYGICNLNK